MQNTRFHSALAVLISLSGCSESPTTAAAAGGTNSGGTLAALTGGAGSAGAARGGSPTSGGGGTAAAAAGPGVGGRATGGAGNTTTGGVISGGGNGTSGGGLGAGGIGENAGRAGGSGNPSAGAGGGGKSGVPATGGAGGSAGSPARCGPVTEVPEAVRTRLDLDPFYKKHVDANGLSVLSSDAPDDQALILACELLHNMLGDRDDVRQELIRRRARFAIIGKDEGTADIPEYGYRDRPQEDIDYINQRARGLGGNVASCGEENILCLQGDRYSNESICVHEFSHTISIYGVASVDDSFEDELREAYDSAMASGILDDSYRSSNEQEYWAEGVQDWYDTNASANPPNGIHNSVDTRVELEDFDPALYALISTIFPDSTEWGDCHADD